MFHLQVAQSDFQQRVDDKEASQLEGGSVSKELTCQEGFACCQLPPSLQLEQEKRPGKEQAAALQLCVHTKHHSAIVEDDKKGFLVVKSSQPAKQNLLTKDTALTGLKYCCGFH